MDSVHFTSESGDHTVEITRAAPTQWQAVEDGRVVGRGEAWRRPDGRVFLSIDVWHDVVFDRLAGLMLAELPTPLYTVVDEADLDLTANWERAGFTAGRREWDYRVPTDPHVTGLDTARPPTGVTIVSGDAVAEDRLRALDRAIRDEVGTIGWRAMPAEVLPRPAGTTVLAPPRYTVAVASDQYVGLVRVAPMTRRARIGLIAVRTDRRRSGIGGALLAAALDSLHRNGIGTASAEVDESNTAAVALFDGIGGTRAGSARELVRR